MYVRDTFSNFLIPFELFHFLRCLACLLFLLRPSRSPLCGFVCQRDNTKTKFPQNLVEGHGSGKILLNFGADPDQGLDAGISCSLILWNKPIPGPWWVKSGTIGELTSMSESWVKFGAAWLDLRKLFCYSTTATLVFLSVHCSVKEI